MWKDTCTRIILPLQEYIYLKFRISLAKYMVWKICNPGRTSVISFQTSPLFLLNFVIPVVKQREKLLSKFDKKKLTTFSHLYKNISQKKLLFNFYKDYSAKICFVQCYLLYIRCYCCHGLYLLHSNKTRKSLINDYITINNNLHCNCCKESYLQHCKKADNKQ